MVADPHPFHPLLPENLAGVLKVPCSPTCLVPLSLKLLSPDPQEPHYHQINTHLATLACLTTLGSGSVDHSLPCESLSPTASGIIWYPLHSLKASPWSLPPAPQSHGLFPSPLCSSPYAPAPRAEDLGIHPEQTFSRPWDISNPHTHQSFLHLACTSPLVVGSPPSTSTSSW